MWYSTPTIMKMVTQRSYHVASYTNEDENGDKMRRRGRLHEGWSKVGLSLVLRA